MKSRGAEMIFACGGFSVDPDDVTVEGVEQSGARVIAYGAPVMPGSMCLVADLDGIPVLGAPACAIWNKATVIEVFLPRMLAGDGNAAALQDLEDAGGRARHQARTLGGQETDVDRMESIDVLGRVDGHQYCFRVDLGGQGQLHEDPIDIVAPVEFFDQSEQFRSRGRLRRRELFAVDAHFFTGFDFAPHIDLGCGMVAHQDDREAGTHPRRGHGFHFRRNFSANILRDFASVENRGRHSDSEEILSQLPRRAFTSDGKLSNRAIL